MASSKPWSIIHAEREALVADLEPLTDEQWTTPSLCDGWSVRGGLLDGATFAGLSLLDRQLPHAAYTCRRQLRGFLLERSRR